MIKFGMTPLEALKQRGDILSFLTFDDQEHLFLEMERSPATARHIGDLLTRPEPLTEINVSALRAVLNELDPGEYPETRELWPLLRREVHRLPGVIARAVHEATKDLTLAQKMILSEGMADGSIELGLHGIEGTGLGIWGALLGSVIQVGGALAQTKIAGDIQEDIAKDQAKLQLQLGQQRLAAEQEMAEKRLAVEAALKAREIEVAGEIGKAPGATIAGIPVWLIPVLLLGGGVIAFLFWKFKK